LFARGLSAALKPRRLAEIGLDGAAEPARPLFPGGHRHQVAADPREVLRIDQDVFDADAGRAIAWPSHRDAHSGAWKMPTTRPTISRSRRSRYIGPSDRWSAPSCACSN